MSSTKLSIQQASDKLDLTRQQVRNLCRGKKLYAEKLGKAWILEDLDVEEYKSNNNCGNISDKKASEMIKGVQLNFDRPIVLSFFSGAMGLDLGIEKAGFNTVLACETDKACRKTIVSNKPEIALIGDIREYSGSEIRRRAGLRPGEDIDLIIGGPPCQAFSTAGNRKGFEDERGNVFLTYIERIIELNPKYAVIENVRGILSAPLKHRPHFKRGDTFTPLSPDELKGGALRYVLDVLKKAGYGVSFNLYNSANFGTPQKRERVILIANRNGEKLPFLSPTNSETGEFGLPLWNTFEDAIKTLSKDRVTHLNFPDKRLKYYKMLQPGQYWKHLPENLQKEALGKSFYSGGGKTGFLRRLAWDKPSPTLVTHPAMPATDLAHPVELRPLSIEEYKRIQQFPDNWEIKGTIIEQYKQVGNAVPVGLGKAVGDLILNHMKGINTKKYSKFKYSRYSKTDHISWEAEISKIHNQIKIRI